MGPGVGVSDASVGTGVGAIGSCVGTGVAFGLLLPASRSTTLFGVARLGLPSVRLVPLWGFLFPRCCYGMSCFCAFNKCPQGPVAAVPVAFRPC